ncbi:sigma-54-dependent Fis family transcriptional regulator [Gordonia terrae]|uniref:sigma-54-dependent Fis family transcriptional regulator n=1 Tax=Gordonia terrae TaxID=2055 RepID=UPI003F6C924F
METHVDMPRGAEVLGGSTRKREDFTRDPLPERGARSLAQQRLPREVDSSWRRSELCGLDPDRFSPRYEPDRITQDSFVAVSGTVLDRLFQPLDGGPTAVMLTDAGGHIQRAWSGEKPVRKFLAEMGGEPGFLFSEEVLGTNGLGTALETGRPIKIRGSEHFLTAYAPFVCAATPIHHPLTRRLMGAVNVARRLTDDDDLLLPWGMAAAREIEDEMLRRATRQDRLVFDRFVAVARNSRAAVACISERMMICNPAARSIEELGRPFVWEQVAQNSSRGTFTLPTGVTVPIQTDEIVDGGTAVGLVIQLNLQSATRPGSRGKALTAGISRAVDPRLSPADTRRVLVVGEPGTGKSTYAEKQAAAVGDAPMARLDCALQRVEGTAWFSSLAARLAERGSAVLLTHVEAFDDIAATTVCAILDRAGEDGARLFATADIGAPIHQALIDRIGGRVQLDSLAQRPERIPDLIRDLTERHAPRRPAPVWPPETTRILTRAPWTGNIRQLESVVRATLAHSVSSSVQIHDLPPEVLATVATRPLSRLEQLEFTEIMGTLAKTKGNRAQAATLLQIGRTTLYRRLRSFGIDPETTFHLTDGH